MIWDSETSTLSSSTPSTDRTTGLSASTGSHKKDCGAGQEELWQSWQTWLLEQSDPAGKEFAVIVAADHRDAQQLREFMEWLTDQQVVHWTLTEETANDPRKAVEALLQTYLNEINDPTISEVARKAAESDVLRERVRVLEEALRKIADNEAMPAFEYSVKWGEVPMAPRSHALAALLSPAAATEGGEGAHEFVETDVMDRGVRAHYPMRCQVCGEHFSNPRHQKQPS